MKGTSDEIAFWENLWKDRLISWHNMDFNKFLVEFFENENKQDYSKWVALVPLCGKSLDMIWYVVSLNDKIRLAHKGMKVIGIECVEKGILSFIKENFFTFEIDKVNGLNIYSIKEINVKIIQANILDIDSSLFPEKFNFVWDRASFEAIKYGDRQKYTRVIKSLVNDNGIILLNAHEYPREEFPKKPHTISQEDVVEYYGDVFSVKLLQKDSYSVIKPVKQKTSWSFVNTFRLQRMPISYDNKQ